MIPSKFLIRGLGICQGKTSYLLLVLTEVRERSRGRLPGVTVTVNFTHKKHPNSAFYFHLQGPTEVTNTSTVSTTIIEEVKTEADAEQPIVPAQPASETPIIEPSPLNVPAETTAASQNTADVNAELAEADMTGMLCQNAVNITVIST